MNVRCAGYVPLVLVGTSLFAGMSPVQGEEKPLSPEHPAAATNPAGLPVRIVVPPPMEPRFAHLSWNKVVRTQKGTLLLAYIAGRFHGTHGGGSPAVSRSTDGGKTFSAPQVLREFGPGKDYSHSGNLALGVAPDGSLVLLAMAFTGNETNHIFGWRSEDDGVTWKPVDTSELGPDKTGSVFGNIVSIDEEKLLVFGHYRAGAKPHTRGIWMSSSRDHGQTWGPARRISDVPAVEPVVLRSGSRLIGFFRGENDQRGRQFVSVSDDLGQTWKTTRSDLKPQDATRLAAPFAVENPNRKGEILVLTTERAVRGNTPGRIWLWRGDIQKLDWRQERVLLEFLDVNGDPHTDFGYPWLVPTDDNRWLMFYYHGRQRGECPLWVTDIIIP